eukprot:m51a1_g4776 hypothetical protein (93) ;mRNA; r:30213-30580
MAETSVAPSDKRLTAESPVTELPGVGEAVAEMLWANAYVRTVGELAALPTAFPGIARALEQLVPIPELCARAAAEIGVWGKQPGASSSPQPH